MKINYKEAEKQIKEKAGKYYSTLAQINKDLAQREEQLKEAERQKEYNLNNGTEESYLKSCAQLDSLNHSIEYLKNKKANLINACGIGTEGLKEAQGLINQARAEAGAKFLKQFAAKYEELNNSLQEYLNDYEQGNALFSELFQIWKDGRSTREIETFQFFQNPGQDIINIKQNMYSLGRAVDYSRKK